jgi:hypothetical protein
VRKLPFFDREPRGSAYDAFVSFACEFSASVLLVVHPYTGLGPTGSRVLADLQPWLLRSEDRQTWPGTGRWPDAEELPPGTESLFDTARVHVFRATGEVAAILQDACRGVFDWLQPRRPEDLAFLDDKEHAWFGSIAHEREAFLDVTDDEFQQIAKALPWISSYVSPAQAE